MPLDYSSELKLIRIDHHFAVTLPFRNVYGEKINRKDIPTRSAFRKPEEANPQTGIEAHCCLTEVLVLVHMVSDTFSLLLFC